MKFLNICWKTVSVRRVAGLLKFAHLGDITTLGFSSPARKKCWKFVHSRHPSLANFGVSHILRDCTARWSAHSVHCILFYQYAFKEPSPLWSLSWPGWSSACACPGPSHFPTPALYLTCTCGWLRNPCSSCVFNFKYCQRSVFETVSVYVNSRHYIYRYWNYTSDYANYIREL